MMKSQVLPYQPKTSNRWLVRPMAAACAVAAASITGLATQPAMAALEEVMVTATRRTTTDIQTTPIAISALNSELIDELVPRDLGDIAAQVPNFVAGKQPGFRSAAFAIRGVGTTSIIVYQDAQVGVTIDDFVLPSVQTQNTEIFDIEQIEVLRGPQGTLFGKNTTGGVINIKTKKPRMDENSVELQGKVEEYGRYEGRAALNWGATDTLAFRAAGIYIKSDGYYENGASYGPVTPFSPNAPYAGATGQGDGDDIGGDDVFSGRLKALWEPTDNFSALVQYEIIRDKGDSPPSVNTTPIGAPLTFNALGLTQDSGDPIKNAAVTDRDDLLLNMSDGHVIDVDGYYLNMDWTVGDYTLSSVTGYREQDSELPSTYVGEVGPGGSLFDANRQDERETFQQEVRIASQFDGAFNFVAGAFYQTDDTTFCVNQVLGFLDLFGLGFDNFGDPTFFDNNPQVLCNEQEAENWAVFGDVTYDFTDRWSLGAGFRWTEEEKDWKGRNQVFYQALGGGFDPNLTWEDFSDPLGAADFNLYNTGVVEDNESWEEPTYRATISYQATDDTFTYFTYSRGFKSGGYNDQTGTSGNEITPELAAPTDPEIADSFELGLKTEALDNNLRLDLAAFYVEYSDAQRDLVTTFTNEFGAEFQETRFFNAAEMEVWGLEAQFAWALTDNFTLRGNASYLDSEYKEFIADTNGDGMDDIDLSDRPVNRAPEWLWNVDAVYQHELFGGNMSWLVNANYEDDAIFVYSVVDPAFDGKTDSRTLFNASVTFTSEDSRYFVRVYGKNLTDETYKVGELPVADLWTFAYYGEPRAFGMEVGVNFGD
ncbi:MAG: TonB-dependent receptor [Pseudomonadota bacterium]